MSKVEIRQIEQALSREEDDLHRLAESQGIVERLANKEDAYLTRSGVINSEHRKAKPRHAGDCGL